MKIGDRIKYKGRYGTILEIDGEYLLVEFDDNPVKAWIQRKYVTPVGLDDDISME